MIRGSIVALLIFLIVGAPDEGKEVWPESKSLVFLKAPDWTEEIEGLRSASANAPILEGVRVGE